MIISNPFVISPIFEWNYTCEKPIVDNPGGTSAGKTYSILQVLILKGSEVPNQIITVCGQDVPNLKAGAMRTLGFVLNDSPYLAAFFKGKPNKTDRVWTMHNGTIIEFKSFDDEQDAKGGRRDYLFVNEANGVRWDIFEQLHVRTSKQTFIDYNPTGPFWAHKNLKGRSDVQTFISNYKHNPNLSKAIVAKIELWKIEDPEKWKVYGLGKTGKTKGVIFKDVTWIDSLPSHISKFVYGMDFGFNDPTTLVKLGTSDGELYVECLLYESGLITSSLKVENKDVPNINDRLIELGIKKTDTINADNADPKTIRELKLLGWRIRGAKKGKGSILAGINKIKKYKKLNIVNRKECKEEQIGYIWGEDKFGEPTDEPIDDFNHFWDGTRYGIQGLNRRNTSSSVR